MFDLTDDEFDKCLDHARRTLDTAAATVAASQFVDETFFPEGVAKLQWFLTPEEASSCLQGNSIIKVDLPIRPLPTQPLVHQPYPGSLSGSNNIR